jgi:hypothetical protein
MVILMSIFWNKVNKHKLEIHSVSLEPYSSNLDLAYLLAKRLSEQQSRDLQILREFQKNKEITK